MLAVCLGVIDDASDRLLFERVYRAFRDQMYYLALSILDNEADAEDAVGEVFLRIASRYMYVLKRIENRQDMRNYLLKSVKNQSLNMLDRRKKTGVPIEYAEAEITDSDFTDAVCTRLDYEAAVEAIRSLDGDCRDAMYCHFVLELTAPETAAVLGRKVSTVKKQLVRGKKQLLERLEREVES